MGAWGTGNFENDDAADFVYDFKERGLEAVREALAEALEVGDYLDAYVATTATAAAEFVSAAAGDASGLSEEAREVFGAFSGDKGALAALKPEAARAMANVVGEKSELIELWEEDGVDTEDCKAAKSALNGLLARVS